MEIKMFNLSRASESKTTFYRFEKERQGFYKIKPSDMANHYAEITCWCNIPSNKSLWVKIRGYDNHNVLMDSEEIIRLAEVLKKLKKIPEKGWKIK